MFFFFLKVGYFILFVAGPGCSSVGYGATQEIGPFMVTDSNGIQFNSFSWNTGTGFAQLFRFNFHTQT